MGTGDENNKKTNLLNTLVKFKDDLESVRDCEFIGIETRAE
jgi:hypothetical protein